MTIPVRVSARFSLLALGLALIALPPVAAPAQRGKAPAAARGSAAPADKGGGTVAGDPLAGVDRSAWLYKDSDLPPDADWHFGTLPNGLRYAVRKNTVPAGQVAVRVRVDAGSLNEADSERGFAHLIEHLSFRGSAFVPDGEAKRIWQRLGTTFGSDTNAQTGFVSTTYKLALPSATEGSLDESLKIMMGMVSAPNIVDQALNAERPVVLAEQRESVGPQLRLAEALNQTLFAGQPLAERLPIGTVQTLTAATAASVKAFHDRWYRPERTVVIISGDMDPAVLERLVVRNFSGWRVSGPPTPDTDFGKPDPRQNPVRAVSEPTLPALLRFAVLRPWRYNSDTALFNQKRMVDTVAVNVIGRRLERQARLGASFLQADVSIEDVNRSANVTFVSIVPIGDDWERALRDVRAVIADAQKAPPSQAEIDQEVALYETALRTQVETARAEAGAAQTDNMVAALDIRETVTTPETAYQILLDAKKANFFTPEAVFAATKRAFTGDATRAIVNLKRQDPGAAKRLEAALNADVSKIATTRRAIASVTFAQLPSLGAPGTVTAQQAYSGIRIEKVEQIDFSNGVRLMLWPNKAETGRVYVRVRFGGGYNALPANRPTPAWAAPLALVQSGVGPFGLDALEQLTQGRRIGMDFAIDEDAFVLGATTSPQDLADQLRLLATKLDHPGWDPRPFNRARAAALLAYDGQSASAQEVAQRDLQGLLRAGDPRWATPPKAQVMATTAAQFRAFWEPILTTGPVEVQVFGDVERDAAIKAVSATLGAIRPRPATPIAAPPVRFPAPVKAPVKRYHEGPADQAVAVIAWPTGGGIDGQADNQRLELLAQVFTDRLFERLRSEAGASYSPSVSSDWPVGLASGGRVVAIGQVEPGKVDYFLKMARDIAADLAAKPIETDEFRRLFRPYLELLERSSSGNTFWFTALENGTRDPKRIEALRHLTDDLRTITPATLQATAQRYLRPEAEWSLAILPRALAPKAAPTPAAPARRAGRR